MAVELPSVWIHELTWQEIEQYLAESDTVIVPIGNNDPD